MSVSLPFNSEFPARKLQTYQKTLLKPMCHDQTMTQNITPTLKRGLGQDKDSYGLGQEDVSTPSGILQTRYIFCIMVFFGRTLAFSDRMLLNVAIVGMVNHQSKLQIWIVLH